jgi:RNA polymerase sigma-70 factor (ECF subfamily)
VTSGVDARSRVRADSRESFEEFFAAYSARLVGQVSLITGDVGEAQDCVQEAFARAWIRWPSVVEHPDPAGWVRLTAVRLATSRFRRRMAGLRAWQRHGPAGSTDGPSPDTLVLLDALRRIPVQQRVAVVLHHLVGLPVAEVARQTGTPVGTVKARLSRGRAALAELLRTEEDHV